jgi:hypothetical protein
MAAASDRHVARLAFQSASVHITMLLCLSRLSFFILEIGKTLDLLSADTTGMGRSWWRAGSNQVTRSAGWRGPGAAGRSLEGQHGGAAAGSGARPSREAAEF